MNCIMKTRYIHAISKTYISSISQRGRELTGKMSWNTRESIHERSCMASRSPAPSWRLIPLHLLYFLCDRVPSHQVFSHQWGKLRLKDEMGLLSTRQPIMANRESLCQRRGNGWSKHSLSCPLHSRLGFTSHQRELLYGEADV